MCVVLLLLCGTSTLKLQGFIAFLRLRAGSPCRAGSGKADLMGEPVLSSLRSDGVCTVIPRLLSSERLRGSWLRDDCSLYVVEADEGNGSMLHPETLVGVLPTLSALPGL